MYEVHEHLLVDDLVLGLHALLHQDLENLLLEVRRVGHVV